MIKPALGTLPRMNLWILVMAVAISAILLPLSASAQSSEELSIGVAAPLDSMDPLGSDVTSDRAILTNIFDTLVQRNANGELEPDLATSWKRVDKLTWRFHLRKGVKFHNGNPFTWQDVKFTLHRLKNPKVSQYLNFGSSIASVKRVDGDPWTIDVKTSGSVPYLVQFLPNIFIMDRESTEARPQGEVGLKPIGTGPYHLVRWVQGSYLKLGVDDRYWGQQPTIKQVTVRPISEASTRMASISSGQIDILQGVPVSLIKAIKRNPQVKLISRAGRRSIFLRLTNQPGSPMAKLNVRKAVYMAINEQAIIDKLLFGHATASAQIPDPVTVGYSKDVKRLPYNPHKAKVLLKKAGYGDGFKLTLAGPNNRYVQDKQIVSTIASQLAKVGIDVSVETMPKAVYFPRVIKHDFDFYVMGWLDGAHDFGRTFNKLLRTVNAKKGFGGFNGPRYSSPALDQQAAKAGSIIDPQKRGKALQHLNRMAMQQVASIPLHYQEDDYAVRKGRGIHFQPRADKYLEFKDMAIATR